ncbi:alpha/beta hydrolase [Streptomyces sp. A7024]|uniref:Alpha/beta hydrolase n=1 Tax=Streptomyces coryli TaxID=1128680 RepID=A0A6G4U7N8_9ACTN|nr:alpha/beta hydrolase [Streptomyces coryli]NGN68255.1 alpha/beta hydrolase [Streptomyces coryli]
MHRSTRRAAALISAALFALAGSCSSAAPDSRQDGGREPGAAGGTYDKGRRPALADRAPCADLPGYTCATLPVPLDHGGRVPGTLGLQVAMADNADAPKGVLMLLTGGPGQPGVPFVKRLSEKLKPVLDDYRLVMVDQRGTGGAALQCPQLQEEMGSSDLTPPTQQAVTDCADALGDKRRFYATADTVADLDLLRRALRERKWTLDGVSYGTFTAERYALAHPGKVRRLVLDSVVPQTLDDPMWLTPMRATARILRAACAAKGCGTDPVADLREVVRTYGNGADLLAMLTTYEFFDPDYEAAIAALHKAARGDASDLKELIERTRQDDTPAEQLSQGLHASTLCLDGRFPWGTTDSPVEGRAAKLAAAAERLTPRDYGPYDADAAQGTGSLLQCLWWPREPVPKAPPAGRKLPEVPVLLLGGDRDLSTPLEWLYEQEKLTPRGEVVVVKGAAHGIQSRAASDAGRQAVYDFLLRD